MGYERDNIQQMTAYTPGEQPQGQGAVIKLNTNENPYPPIEPVMKAIRTLSAEALRKYPSPAAMTFRRTAAQVHGLMPENIIATNGGDELLRLAISVFCEPRHGDLKSPCRGEDFKSPCRLGIGVCEPSYSLYPVLAKAHDTPVTAVPLLADHAIAEDFEERLLAAGVGLALIVNPHAPSGRLYDLDRLRRIAMKLRGQAVLLIDEAYCDFAGQDCLPLVKEGLDNVLLLRTMSKGYSLAGLRFGYGMGHANLIAAMDKVRDSYNTDALAQAAATAALANRSLAAESWRKVIAERTRMTQELLARGWQVSPSHTNFLLTAPSRQDAAQAPSRQGGAGASWRAEAPPCRDGASNAAPPCRDGASNAAPPCRDGASNAAPPCRDGASTPLAREIYESLKARNILVRYFDHEGLRDKLRITIGTPEQNDAVLKALDAMMKP